MQEKKNNDEGGHTCPKSLDATPDCRIVWSQVTRFVTLLLLLAASTLVAAKMAASADSKRTGTDAAETIMAMLPRDDSASTHVEDVDTVTALGLMLISSGFRLFRFFR